MRKSSLFYQNITARNKINKSTFTRNLDGKSMITILKEKQNFTYKQWANESCQSNSGLNLKGTAIE